MIRFFWNSMGLGIVYDGFSRVVRRLLVGLVLGIIGRDFGEVVL